MPIISALPVKALGWGKARARPMPLKIAWRRIGGPPSPRKETKATAQAGLGDSSLAMTSERLARNMVPHLLQMNLSDLLVLIPSAMPILQVDLWKAVRAAEINSKYARRFLHALIAEKLVDAVLIPRERARSPLGYFRVARKSPPKACRALDPTWSMVKPSASIARTSLAKRELRICR
jgi:hypothetical protein